METDAPLTFQTLQQASRDGDIEMVRRCLSHGVDQNEHPGMPRESSPLMRAASSGHLEIVQLLLDDGPNINLTCGDSFSALTLAGEHRHWDVMLLLAEYGADFSIRNATGRNGFDYVRSRCRSQRMRAKIEAVLASRSSEGKDS